MFPFHVLHARPLGSISVNVGGRHGRRDQDPIFLLKTSPFF
jgi:hypothetical protein